MKPLANQNAIVTGAARGIGAAIALALAEAGANVAVNDLDASEELQAVARQCEAFGVRVRLAVCDAGCQKDVERIVEETVSQFGPLHLAVSNAAFSDRQLFYQADMEGFEKTVQVTMWGAFYLLRAVTRRMVATETAGSIVVVSSSHSWRPIPGAMAYNMSKAAVDQMVRTAATELCQKGIRVNLVHPGWTDTPGERKHFAEEKIKSKAQQLPMGRMAKPEEIARAVVFFCNPDSSYITGSSLLVDGGGGLPVHEMHRLELPGS